MTGKRLEGDHVLLIDLARIVMSVTTTPIRKSLERSFMLFNIGVVLSTKEIVDCRERPKLQKSQDTGRFQATSAR
jgi:hypothetical protein